MVCLLTPTVAARWIAEKPRFCRSFPRLVSISGILLVVILSGTAGHRILSCMRYIDTLTRHAHRSSPFRSRHARGPLPVLLRAGWKSRIVRRDSGSAGPRGDPGESDQPRTSHRRPVRRRNRRPRIISSAGAGGRTICADDREARLPPLPAGGHHTAHRRPDPAQCKAGIGASLAVGGGERPGVVAGNG